MTDSKTGATEDARSDVVSRQEKHRNNTSYIAGFQHRLSGVQAASRLENACGNYQPLAAIVAHLRARRTLKLWRVAA